MGESTDRGMFLPDLPVAMQAIRPSLHLEPQRAPGRPRSANSSAETLSGTAESMGRQRATLRC